MLKILLRPAMIFVPFTLGLIFPQGANFQWSIRIILIIMMTMAFIKLDFSQLKPKAIHFIILGINILMGVVPFFVLKFLFPSEEGLALAAFFTGITPTATAAPIIMSFLNGRMEFVVTGFIITNFGIAATLIFLIPLVTGDNSYSFDFNLLIDLLKVTLLPFVLAFVIRRISKNAVKIAGRLKMFSFALWSFLLFIFAGVARTHFIENPNEDKGTLAAIFIMSFVICTLNFLIGALIAPRRFKREASQTLGQKNTTLTIYLALAYASPLASLGPLFYILWHNTYNATQMFLYDRHKLMRKLSSKDAVKGSVKG